MDFGQLFNTLLNSLPNQVWYFVPLFILLPILRTPWFKCKAGEAMVNIAAKLSLDKARYHLIKNVTLPTEDGTTQIDHIIVSQYGVFVAETKNMKGWIFGSAKQHYWTQKIFKHSQKFQNPFHQNYKHVKTLRKLFGLSDERIHLVVLFAKDSIFKTDMPDNGSQRAWYLNFIKSHLELMLTATQVKRIEEALNSVRLKAVRRTHREDRSDVQHVVAYKSALTNQGGTTQEKRVPDRSTPSKGRWTAKLELAFVNLVMVASILCAGRNKFAQVSS